LKWTGKSGGGGRRRMSEERPVPRRESPWGLPEGDKRQPKAHRCNDRVEDVVQVPSLDTTLSL
jgi:hypothetical protein